MSKCKWKTIITGQGALASGSTCGPIIRVANVFFFWPKTAVNSLQRSVMFGSCNNLYFVSIVFLFCYSFFFVSIICLCLFCNISYCVTLVCLFCYLFTVEQFINVVLRTMRIVEPADRIPSPISRGWDLFPGTLGATPVACPSRGMGFHKLSIRVFA